MSFFSVGNVKITGVSACVPNEVEEVSAYPLFSQNDASNFSKNTGVLQRRKAQFGVCSSDLCLRAAEKLVEELNWNKSEIECLIFVTQTPDFTLPSTSTTLQSKLRLPTTCFALDISLGCSGWVYGLSVISSLLSHGGIKKGLLLAGDTILKVCSVTDKSTYPLFGDAGTATALEFSDNIDDKINFCFNSDGDGSEVIMIKDGGFRNPVNEKSFVKHTISEGIERSNLDLTLDGMDVFSFGISKAPESINKLIDHFSIELESIDYFTFHQANKFMNEKIRKKLKLPEEKVPYSLSDFENTSCATIPLTMVTQLRDKLTSNKLSHVACGFGVGLSWGSCYFHTDHIVCPELIEY